MTQFLVNISEDFDELFIINAIDHDDALKKLCEVYAIDDELFIEQLYSKTTNFSFAEKFWINEEDDQCDFSEYSLVDDDTCKQRIRDYFELHQDYAELFINYFFGENKNNGITKFPDDMIKFIWLKDIHKDCKVTIIDMSTIKII